MAFAREGAKVFLTYLQQSPELFVETRKSSEKAATPGRAYYCKKISQSADQVVNKISGLEGDGSACEIFNYPLGFNLAT